MPDLGPTRLSESGTLEISAEDYLALLLIHLRTSTALVDLGSAFASYLDDKDPDALKQISASLRTANENTGEIARLAAQVEKILAEWPRTIEKGRGRA